MVIDPPPVSDPAAGAGNPCDDTAMIGPAGNTVSILDRTQTTAIGNAVTPGGGFAAGRALRYNRQVDNDKPATARANVATPNVFTMTTTANVATLQTTANATATQTVTTPGGGGGIVTGLATATITHVPAALLKDPAHAIGIVNDPLEIGLLDLGIAGSADVTIGGGIQLQADDTGDTASVLYLLGVGSQVLVSFGMAIDFYTGSLQEVGFTFFAFDPALGFPDESAFVSYLAGFLSFDSAAHMLTATGDIPLFHLDIPAGSAPVVLTYNYAAITGSVPAPGTLLLMAAGLILLASRGGMNRPARFCRNTLQSRLLPQRTNRTMT